MSKNKKGPNNQNKERHFASLNRKLMDLIYFNEELHGTLLNQKENYVINKIHMIK